jgi:hypothetical protein
MYRSLRLTSPKIKLGYGKMVDGLQNYFFVDAFVLQTDRPVELY